MRKKKQTVINEIIKSDACIALCVRGNEITLGQFRGDSKEMFQSFVSIAVQDDLIYEYIKDVYEVATQIKASNIIDNVYLN